MTQRPFPRGTPVCGCRGFRRPKPAAVVQLAEQEAVQPVEDTGLMPPPQQGLACQGWRVIRAV